MLFSKVKVMLSSSAESRESSLRPGEWKLFLCGFFHMLHILRENSILSSLFNTQTAQPSVFVVDFSSFVKEIISWFFSKSNLSLQKGENAFSCLDHPSDRCWLLRNLFTNWWGRREVNTPFSFLFLPLFPCFTFKRSDALLLWSLTGT